MQESIIDVVVPCFKQGSFLESALSSIAMAIDRPHAVIVVDDASPDRLTHLAIKSLRPSCDFQELKVITHRLNSGGVATPRNTGFAAGMSEFALFLDADDLLVEGSLTDVLDEMARTKDHIAIGGWAPLTGSVAIGSRIIPHIPYSMDSRWVFRNWERGLTIPIHCAIFRRDNFAIGEKPFCEVYQSKEDFDFWTRFFHNKKTIFRSKIVQALYRYSSGSMSQHDFYQNGLAFCRVARDLSLRFPALFVDLENVINYAIEFYGQRVPTHRQELFKLEIEQLLNENVV